MSDHSDVEEFETADAGASTTVPMQAGSVRKGGFMVIKGRPTKVRLRGNRAIPRRRQSTGTRRFSRAGGRATHSRKAGAGTPEETTPSRLRGTGTAGTNAIPASRSPAVDGFRRARTRRQARVFRGALFSGPLREKTLEPPERPGSDACRDAREERFAFPAESHMRVRAPRTRL